MNEPQAVLIDAIRTPIGKIGGTLSSVRPDDMMGNLLNAMSVRHPWLTHQCDDVIVGCANQAGEDGRNIARMAILSSNFPFEIPGQTINRLCSSSMQAVASAAMTIQSGFARTLLAGGVESMSRAPYAVAKAEKAFPNGPMTMYDTALGWRFINPRITKRVRPLSMGETAEEIFKQFAITRETQDAFAVASHRKAIAARNKGSWKDEIIALRVRQGKNEVLIDTDECPREDASIETLSKLKPAFRDDGTVTAGNSCPMNDGASLLLLVSPDVAKESGHREGFVLRGYAVTGIHPDIMGLGPVEATRRALQYAHVSLNDIDLIEINEAFAIQVLACMQALELDDTRVNVNGGAIALGHPLGCSGARIIGSLTNEMKRR
ncbi:MAG TPA: thiolase family protein, partial [bacterium]|nr:thiolase family protein [bacterium]HNL27410.1 thiolase family protein [bacterium]